MFAVHLVVGLSGEGKDHAGNALEIYSGPPVIVRGPVQVPQVDWLQRLLAAIVGQNPYHDADTNANALIELAEVLRVIQLHKAQGYHCVKSEAMTEDGFAPGNKGIEVSAGPCAPHTADYDPMDELIDFGELLRIIQFYNSGPLSACEAGEDGFCPAAQ